MICFKRNILIVLMIFVNIMPFNCVMALTNKGFKKCYSQMQNAFLLFGKTDFIAPDSPLHCVKNAIKYLSENDNLGSDLRDYYNKFPGQVNGDKIIDRKTFCAEINDEILDHSAKTHPATYYDEYLKAHTSKVQISPSMFLYKLFEAGTSRDKDEQIQVCVKELAVFGSSNDEILDLAIRKYRISFRNKKLDHIFCERSKAFGFQYLIHISEVVTLKDNSNLVTPWDYCSDRHSDKEQENAKPEDQLSTSQKEIS